MTLIWKERADGPAQGAKTDCLGTGLVELRDGGGRGGLFWEPAPSVALDIDRRADSVLFFSPLLPSGVT